MRVLVVGRGIRTAELLERDGHVVTLTTDAEKTLQMDSSFDALIVDTSVPSRQALALCRVVRARGDLPVVVLIEEGSAGARVRALEAGADDCLSMPLLVDELEARLRAITRRCFGLASPAAGGA